MILNKCQQPTNGLASCGVYARGKFCGNLKVCRPSELLCSPARTPSRQPIHESNFSFDFDMLLLDKYYQPCDKQEFDEWIDEFKEQYKEKYQQDYLNKLKWKQEDTVA